MNEEKRKKFIEIAEKRVNNCIHDIEILRPMAKSTNYDYTKEDVEGMFSAIESTLTTVKEEYLAKFEKQEKQEKKAFSFGKKQDEELDSEILSLNEEE